MESSTSTTSEEVQLEPALDSIPQQTQTIDIAQVSTKDDLEPAVDFIPSQSKKESENASESLLEPAVDFIPAQQNGHDESENSPTGVVDDN